VKKIHFYRLSGESRQAILDLLPNGIFDFDLGVKVTKIVFVYRVIVFMVLTSVSARFSNYEPIWMTFPEIVLLALGWNCFHKSLQNEGL